MNFKKISIEEFTKILEKASKELLGKDFDEDWLQTTNWTRVSSYVKRDLSRIEFSDENIFVSNQYINKNYQNSLLGINQLSNGLCFLGVNSSGDWELGVFFIVYWDGEDLRGFIPLEGNTFNEKRRCAWVLDNDNHRQDLISINPNLKQHLQENGLFSHEIYSAKELKMNQEKIEDYITKNSKEV